MVVVSYYGGTHHGGATSCLPGTARSSAEKATRSITAEENCRFLCDSDAILPRMTSRGAAVMYSMCCDNDPHVVQMLTLACDRLQPPSYLRRARLRLEPTNTHASLAETSGRGRQSQSLSVRHMRGLRRV